MAGNGVRAAILEALHRESEDLNERERKLRDAALEKLGAHDVGWLAGFYDTHVVVELEGGGYKKIPYTMEDDGEPVLGEPVDVERTVTFTPKGGMEEGAPMVATFIETGRLVARGVE